MSIFSWIGNLFESNISGQSPSQMPLEQLDVVNPANGLPMIGGMGGVDIEGNLFGTDEIHGPHENSESQVDWLNSSHSSFDDSFNSSYDNFGASLSDDF